MNKGNGIGLSLILPLDRYWLFDAEVLLKESQGFPVGATLVLGIKNSFYLRGRGIRDPKTGIYTRHVTRAVRVLSYRLPIIDPEHPTEFRTVAAATFVLENDLLKNEHQLKEAKKKRETA